MHRNSNKPNSVFKVFEKTKLEVPSIYISSHFRLNDFNHSTGKAIDISSKNIPDILKAYEKICKEYLDSNIRIGIGIELADRHIHLDPFVEKKCKKKFIETTKTNSFCVDHLSCDEIIQRVKKYY